MYIAVCIFIIKQSIIRFYIFVDMFRSHKASFKNWMMAMDDQDHFHAMLLNRNIISNSHKETVTPISTV